MVISRQCLSEIEAHAVRDYPRECCGVLLGSRAGAECKVIEVRPCRNVVERPETSYRIEPTDLIAIQRDARDRGLQVGGFYHSHPGRPAEPSARDLKKAEWDNCSYLIVSVAEVDGVAQAGGARSFILVASPSRKLQEEKTRIME